MNIVADRLSRIKPSMTVGINTKANALRAEGKDILVLAAGEPDFDTPVNIREAAIKAMNEGLTRYVPGKGTPALQNAIINKFKKENNLEYSNDEIMVGVGGKHIIYNAMMATLNPGDEVIIPAPYWVSYPDIVLLAEGKPVIVECPESQNFKLMLISETMKPGETQLIVIFFFAYSIAKLFDIATIPAFEAE